MAHASQQLLTIFRNNNCGCDLLLLLLLYVNTYLYLKPFYMTPTTSVPKTPPTTEFLSV
jgi:hypothetical protein